MMEIFHNNYNDQGMTVKIRFEAKPLASSVSIRITRSKVSSSIAQSRSNSSSSNVMGGPE